MKAGYTDIIFVLDCSGSMESIKSDTIGGFNGFIKSQREIPGKCTISLLTFNTDFSWKYEDEDINAKRLKLTNKNYFCGGGTALYDAICKAVDEVGAAYSYMPEGDRPEKVLFVILTDGEENSSKASYKEVASRIKHQTERYNWHFLFIGANQDAIAKAGDIGIQASNAMNYSATKIGTHALYRSMSNVAGVLRCQVGQASPQCIADEIAKANEIQLGIIGK